MDVILRHLLLDLVYIYSQSVALNNVTEICKITIDLAKVKEALIDCSLIAMRNTYGKSFMKIRSFLSK